MTASLDLDPAETLALDLPGGRVLIRLRPDLAPVTVARIKELARAGFYDGTPFHRVIEDFMAQGGDPTGTGTGGSGRNLRAEFSDAPFTRGTVAMARARDPHSADSQFFICFAEAHWLKGQYTVFGEVAAGMEAVDALRKGDPDMNGVVDVPDKVVMMAVLADIPADNPPADKPKKTKKPAARTKAKAAAKKSTAKKPAPKKRAARPAKDA